MRIEKTQQIAGHPARVIRQLLRGFGTGPRDLDFVRRRLQRPRHPTERLLASLSRLGYLTPQGEPGGRCYWQRTPQGAALAMATAARPLHRATAEKKLQAFLVRVATVNRRRAFLYRVTQVVVFGSYLSAADRLNDVDVAVALAPKESDPPRQFAWEQAHTARAVRRGRHFNNLVEQLGWPEREVLLFLKSRSRALSVHTFRDAVLQQTACRVIFEAGEAGPAA